MQPNEKPSDAEMKMAEAVNVIFEQIKLICPGWGATWTNESVEKKAKKFWVKALLDANVRSELEICRSGVLASISVEVDITHAYRGDLNVTVISPDGLPAQLHAPDISESGTDLKQTFSASDTPSLAGLVNAGTDIRGGWTLHVSDNFNRDIGQVNAWFLELRTT